jgi:hypothetical protein
MAGTTENILYVIFHGLISLVDIGDAGFNAYLFQMPPHRYLFGSWLIEDDIPEPSDGTKGPLILTLDSVNAGVLDPPNNVLDPDLNLVIQLNAPLPVNLSGARAVVRLPRPRRIYYYTCGDVLPNSIQGDPLKLINKAFPSIISETRVFEYSFSDSQLPRLLAGDPPAAGSSSLWKPDVPPPVVGNRKVLTLHFYDEPDAGMNDVEAEQHARAEFLLSTALLGVPMALTQASPADNLEPPVPPHKRQPTLKTLGILKREVTPLDERNEAFLDLQFFVRSDPPVERKPPGTGGGGGGPICGGGNAQVVQLSDRSKSGETQKS